MNIFYLIALLSNIRNVRDSNPNVQADTERYSCQIIKIMLSAPPGILQITPDVITNQVFPNAQYLRQIATFCIFLRDKAPGLLNSDDNRLAIANAAKYSEMGFEVVMKLSAFFAANELLTQENFQLICLSPLDVIFFLKDTGLKITPDSAQDSSIATSSLLAQKGLFSKLYQTKPILSELEEPNILSRTN